MVRCYLTGVEFALEDAYVLHRRDVHDHLARLHDRVSSLQRLIAQLSPLDVDEPSPSSGPSGPNVPPRRRHRLVCKAVADALSPGYPEITPFLSWPEYQARVHQLRAQRGASFPVGVGGAPT